jgi:di/tricarboxylate transporter
MNNVGALALMLPVALATAAEHKRSPAMLLMPLAFGSILGGMTTMIGTPPNIIIATYQAEQTGTGFGMFQFSPVGVPVSLLGILFVTIIGWRLIPKARLSQNPPQQLFQVEEYLTEVKVPEGNPLIGQSLAFVAPLHTGDIDVMGLARGNGLAQPVSAYHVIEQDDVYLLRSDPGGLKPVIDELGLKLVTTEDKSFQKLASTDLTLAEGVVIPGSPLEGRTVAFLRRHTNRTVSLVALARQGENVRRRLRRQLFRAGDILLLEGPTETMGDTMTDFGLLPLAQRDLAIGRERRVGLAVSIFGIAIALGVFGVLPLTVTFVMAIVAYILFGILPVRDLYREIDWPVIVLLGAMIPVGRALETTGATELIANSIIGLTAGLPMVLILTLVLVVTMFLSDIINNAATALVMAPIALGIAQQLGVNPEAFLMAVAVGASCAFLTPIGHQSNTLVMGPGGYHFSDYWRMGLPLEILIVAVAVPLLLVFWPL